MRKLTGIILLGLAAGAAGCSKPELGVAKFADGQVQHVVSAKDIPWKSCPPHLPKNCEIAILSGHPKQPDMFTVRFRAPEEMYMSAHTHPKDERVTLLQGTVRVAFGEGATREEARVFGPGDYYINKRGAVHKVWIEKGAVLQITGIGPWEVHFVDKH
ncbi:MAG: cupin domain-containing protein [Gammaproteobacteria bacterium]|nr:cupin domain-containing protein [Gammaproteobacteria bacterium]MDH5650544.1 cupin domain-containing protein [Gammaproteobacteria bacterium]